MKTLVARYLIAVCFCSAVTFVSAEGFKSKIIAAGAAPLVINVPDHFSLRIVNFTQENGTTLGVVQATVNGQSSTVLNARIINASPSSAPSPGIPNHVEIGGPATVTVVAASDAKLFITYKKEQDSTPTPTPTAAPTATVTGSAAPAVAPAAGPIILFSETTPLPNDEEDSAPTPSPTPSVTPSSMVRPTLTPTPSPSPSVTPSG